MFKGLKHWVWFWGQVIWYWITGGLKTKNKGGNIMDWQKVLALLILKALQQMTPELKARLCAMLKDFEKNAHESTNPWDDILAFLLLTLVACD